MGLRGNKKRGREVVTAAIATVVFIQFYYSAGS